MTTSPTWLDGFFGQQFQDDAGVIAPKRGLVHIPAATVADDPTGKRTIVTVAGGGALTDVFVDGVITNPYQIVKGQRVIYDTDGFDVVANAPDSATSVEGDRFAVLQYRTNMVNLVTVSTALDSGGASLIAPSGAGSGTSAVLSNLTGWRAAEWVFYAGGPSWYLIGEVGRLQVGSNFQSLRSSNPPFGSDGGTNTTADNVSAPNNYVVAALKLTSLKSGLFLVGGSFQCEIGTASTLNVQCEIGGGGSISTTGGTSTAGGGRISHTTPVTLTGVASYGGQLGGGNVTAGNSNQLVVVPLGGDAKVTPGDVAVVYVVLNGSATITQIALSLYAVEL